MKKTANEQQGMVGILTMRSLKKNRGRNLVAVLAGGKKTGKVFTVFVLYPGLGERKEGRLELGLHTFKKRREEGVGWKCGFAKESRLHSGKGPSQSS